MIGLTPKLPLALDETDGYATIRSQKEMIQQNFKMLMMTCKGERIMEPDYGVGLPSFLFQQNTEETRQQIEDEILQQAKKNMPYIRILKMNVNGKNSSGDSDLKLSILVEYYISFLGMKVIFET